MLLPFVPMLDTHAADGIQPRFIVFYHDHGVPKAAWTPSGTENDWQLGDVLQPLSAFADRLTIVNGLYNEAGIQSGAGHVYGSRTILNNTNLTSDNQPGGISIDQAIANAIAGNTSYRSLEAGVYGSAQGVNSTGFKEALQAETNPIALFDRVFGDAQLDDGQLERLKADRRSVVDLVKGNLQALQGRVASADKIKIERHLDHIRTIEERIPDLGEIPGGCTMPAIPDLDGQGSTDNYRAVAHLHADLLAASLACGLTNVATLALETVQIQLSYLPGIGDSCHHIHHDGSDADSGAHFDRFKTLVTEYASLFAYFLEQLDGYLDVGGTSVLDNSVAMWTTYYGKGVHQHSDLGFVLAGSAGGALATGRYLEYDETRSTGELYTSLGRLFGLDIDSFGAHGSGPLPGFS
jgi:hypothetical protein